MIVWELDSKTSFLPLIILKIIIKIERITFSLNNINSLVGDPFALHLLGLNCRSFPIDKLWALVSLLRFLTLIGEVLST